MNFIEEYRCKKFSELKGISHITTLLQRYLKSGQFPNMLFSGNPGTGKTTAVRIFCNNYCQNDEQILWFNASITKCIDDIRTQVIPFIQSCGFEQSDKFKLVIFDESDGLTYSSQMILKKIIDDSEHNTRFIFICNNITQIAPAIISRCIKLQFQNVQVEAIETRLKDIDIKLKKIQIKNIAYHANGDMRKALNLAQQVKISSIKLPQHDILDSLDNTTFQKKLQILQELLNDQYQLEDLQNMLFKKLLQNPEKHQKGLILLPKLTQLIEAQSNTKTILHYIACIANTL